jgi:hypothetical protein
MRQWAMPQGLQSKPPTAPPQCADAVLMVRPVCFGYNPETAASNAFQKAGEGAGDGAKARAEFDAFVRALSGEGVTVCVAEDSPDPPKPDAVFPNNWVSFHGDGTLVLYPMEARSRRIERRQEIIDQVVKELRFRVTHFIDLMHHEDEGRYLEGTGSLVLDHAARVAYACASSRTHPELVKEWAEALGYEPLVFQAADSAGLPLYHTNVLLCIGARMAIVGTEAIAPADRQRVLGRLRAGGREVIEIGHRELGQFAGNMLELGTWDEALGDSRVLVMSDTARRALSPETFAQLSGCTDQVLAVPIPTIERCGGGSARCMLAEVFRTP